MSVEINQNPEQFARDKIDKQLSDAGWIIQSKKHLKENYSRKKNEKALETIQSTRVQKNY